MVFISIILIIAVFVGAAYYQTAKLTKVVGDARNGQLVAVVGADIFLEAMSEYVNASTAEGSFICVKAANAGHEYPIIRNANGEFELFKDKHGFVIGGMEGIRYKEYDMQLEKGGTLFLYTDGVPRSYRHAGQYVRHGASAESSR